MVSWISWFCSLPGHSYFVEVPEYFIEDDFNLAGLSGMVNYYEEALDMILDLEDASEDGIEKNVDYDHMKQVEQSAEVLYKLIHQRFLITKQGLHFMASRCQDLEFGICPRWHCGGCCVAPCGLSNEVDVAKVKLYCPRCNDVYEPTENKYLEVDGAAFGTTFATLLFESFPELVPPLKSNGIAMQKIYDSDTSDESRNTSPRYIRDYGIYEMRVYGFKVNIRSPFGPRMQWLRYKIGMDEKTLQLQ
ncbi:casein kinase II, regulatory subunit [Gorgonomyces haynaldii]|nr:casein kinase II, regulatory subunit [Gorgonomyces haynaldii]